MSENELHTISDNLHASHGDSMTHLEAGSLLDEETRKLSLHPTMADATGDVQYLRLGEEKVQRKEIQYVMERAKELEDCFSELESLNLPQIELVKTPNWSEVFTRVDAYNQAIVTLDWKVLEPQEIDTILQKMISTENANRSLSFGSFSLLNIDTFITSDIPDDIFARQYHFTSSDSQLEQSLVRRYIANEMPATARGIKAVLDRVYKKGPQFDGIEPGQDVVVDRLRAMMGEVDFTIYSMEEAPQSLDDKEISAYNDRIVKKMDLVLLDHLGLSSSVVDRFYYAAAMRMTAKSRSKTQHPAYYNGSYIKESLGSIVSIMKTFDPVHISYLSSEMGVVNIDRYSAQDLLNLFDLKSETEDSAERREYLRNGDVTVVFSDAFGDYNGAFDLTADTYRDEYERLLVFEISTPEEMYRRMVLLKKQGIKPSTIVIAAHGAPGSAGFGQWGRGFELVSTRALSSDDVSVALDEANLARLASDEFMQSDTYGKRKIVMNSCSSAVEREGMRSVAESILRTINRHDTAVYASDGVSSTTGDVEQGVKFIEGYATPKQRSSLVELSLVRNEKMKRKALKSLKFDGRKQA